MVTADYNEAELAEADRMHGVAHAAFTDLWREGAVLQKAVAYGAWMQAGREYHRIAGQACS
mgnify:FL=1|jgi:hypothetical protein